MSGCPNVEDFAYTSINSLGGFFFRLLADDAKQSILADEDASNRSITASKALQRPPQPTFWKQAEPRREGKGEGAEAGRGQGSKKEQRGEQEDRLRGGVGHGKAGIQGQGSRQGRG